MDAIVNNGTKLVQMRLQPKTIERLTKLSQLTGTDNRTQLVAASIHLAEELFSAIKEGSTVYIQKPDGTRETIKVIGI